MERRSGCEIGLISNHFRAAILGAISLTILSAPVVAQTGAPVDGPAIVHEQGLPNFLTRMSPGEASLTADVGIEVELGGSARRSLEDHRRLAAALESLAAQRPGTVDAYVVSVALDSDPVFGREAREAAAVFGRRYGADTRTITLAGPDGTRDDLPHGSLSSLETALARVGELMDPREDALVLFVTGHGMPSGVAYHYGDQGFGGMSPARLGEVLTELGIDNRMLVMNACFSGSFVPALGTPRSVVVAAAAADRTSFGCAPANDWTYFGDAFVNRALRRPQGVREAFDEAARLVSQWETHGQLMPSEPRIAVGMAAGSWLDPLEARVPETPMARTGRPAVGPEGEPK